MKISDRLYKMIMIGTLSIVFLICLILLFHVKEIAQAL